MGRVLGILVALSAVIALGCGGDDGSGPGGGGSSNERRGLLLEICERLIEEGFAETCGIVQFSSGDYYQRITGKTRSRLGNHNCQKTDPTNLKSHCASPCNVAIRAIRPRQTRN